MAETSGCAKVAAWGFAILGVLVIVGFVLGQREGESRAAQEADRRAELSPQEREAEDKAAEDRKREQGAEYACRHVLKKSLHDPDSVQWDDSPGWYRERRSDTEWIFQPRARAKNAFGALRHGVWECTVTHDGSSVRVTKLEQIRP